FQMNARLEALVDQPEPPGRGTQLRERFGRKRALASPALRSNWYAVLGSPASFAARAASSSSSYVPSDAPTLNMLVAIPPFVRGSRPPRNRHPSPFDGGEHRTALGDPHAVFVADVCVPDGPGRIEADPVRIIAGGHSPHSPVAERSVGGDVVRGQPLGIRLGHDQRGTVGGDRHSV